MSIVFLEVQCFLWMASSLAILQLAMHIESTTRDSWLWRSLSMWCSMKSFIVVRMYGFTLEGVNGLKRDLKKLLSLEWTFFQIQLIKNSVCQNTKLKAQHQKNNRLFIPVYKNQNWIERVKGERKCTQRFILVYSKPRATSSLLRNHWGISLSNQT